MNESHDPNQTADIRSVAPDSLESGLAAGFRRPAAGPDSVLSGLRSSLGPLQPVLLQEAEGESAHIVQPKSDAMPAPDETGDRYQLQGEIARGGMGAVLRGHDVDLGRDLAVKVLLEKYADRPDVIRRFIEEAQIGGQLQHPGVVPVYDIGRFGQRPFFTMKLVKGKTLAALLAERADPSADRPRLLGILRQVAQTLAYAHARGVIHRDLKPANNMVGAFGEVLVCDWGLAKVLAEGGRVDEERATSRERERPEDATHIRMARSTGSGPSTDTESGSLLGTPAYMPPEQANGDVVLMDRRADVFALGALLCEVLTGKPPYVGRSAEEVRRKAASGDLADARSRLDVCGADQELIGLAKACLSPEASDRPKDAQAVANGLTAYLDGVQARLRQAELAEVEARAKAVEEAKRRRLTLVLAATVLLAVTLGSGGWLWVKADRDARQAQLTRDVNAALNQAMALREKAKAATTGSVALFAQAREQAQRALALVGSGQVDDALKDQVTQLQTELDEEAKDRKLLAALEDARLAQAEAQSGTAFAFGEAVPIFRKAFADYGLPAGEGTPAAAAECLRQRPVAVREAVSADLDEWIDVATNPRFQISEPHLDWLKAVAKAAEPADDWTREFRTILAVKEAAKRRAGLEEMATKADVRKLPAQTLNRLAQRLALVQDWATAAHLLRRARRLYPADFWINHNLGIVLQKLQPPEQAEAVRYLTAAVALRPYSPVARNDLGVALLRKGALDEAIACFHQAIQLDPQYALAHSNLGGALCAKGRQEEGIACFRQAVALAPKDPISHFELGLALSAQGKVEEAIQCFHQAIALDQKFAPAHTSLGNALRAKGALDEAIACHRRATKLGPKLALTHYNLGVALQDKGEVAEAIACFQETIALDPKFIKAHNNLGLALYGKGLVNEAIACYKQAITFDPKFAAAHVNLGNALRDKGQVEEAIACYHEAIKLDPKLALAHDHLGVALYGKGEVAEAIACHQEAIKLDPKLALAHLHLGVALYGKGEVAEAMAYFEQAIKLDPKLALAHGALGVVLLRQGRFTEAKNLSVRALKLLPANDPLRAAASQQVQTCVRLLRLEERLPRILKGEDRVESAQEGLDLAAICRLRRKFAAAAFFTAASFAADPKLTQSVGGVHRYQAACAAALAAAAQGEDAAQLDEQGRARLRQQALGWLRADLTALRELIVSGPPASRAAVPQVLWHWQQNSQLANLRDPAALALLPAAERAALIQFWADVNTLLKKTETPSPKEDKP
jgi:serine/threonine-protein kinase